MFGEIKGLRPHGDYRVAAVIVLGAVELIGFFGYLGGFFDRPAGGRLEWHEFAWDRTAVLSTIALWAAWLTVMFMLYRSGETLETKIGGGVLISLPVGIFLLLFFELIELGPR